MHSGTYSLSDDVTKTYVLQVVDMVEHVLSWPLQQKEQLIYDDIQKVRHTLRQTYRQLDRQTRIHPDKQIYIDRTSYIFIISSNERFILINGPFHALYVCL